MPQECRPSKRHELQVFHSHWALDGFGKRGGRSSNQSESALGQVPVFLGTRRDRHFACPACSAFVRSPGGSTVLPPPSHLSCVAMRRHEVGSCSIARHCRRGSAAGMARRTDCRWAQSWSPERISQRLALDFPDDASMRISHEAIYQAIYIQGRGALKRELMACLPHRSCTASATGQDTPTRQTFHHARTHDQ